MVFGHWMRYISFLLIPTPMLIHPVKKKDRALKQTLALLVRQFLPVSFSSVILFLVRILYCHLIHSSFLILQNHSTASAEKACNFEQTHKGWLFLHVPAFIGAWDGSSCCGNIYVD